RELFLARLILERLHHLLKSARRASGTQRLATLADTIVGDLTGASLVLDDSELIARFGSRVKAENFDRNRGAGLDHVLAAIVDQCAYPAPGRSRDHDIPNGEGAAL